MCLMVGREGKEKVVVAKDGDADSEKVENLLLILALLRQTALGIEKQYEIKAGMEASFI